MHLEWTEFVDALGSPFLRRQLGGVTGHFVVVTGDPEPSGPIEEPLIEAAGLLPAVVVMEGSPATVAEGPAALVDVVAKGADLETVLATCRSRPVAATALALLLRGSERRTVGDGLIAESAVYAALQAGPEFLEWRATHPAGRRDLRARPAVRVDRSEDRLMVTLDRPEVRNALDAAMRDELWEALLVAAADPTIQVVLRGSGVSFSSGGDLEEFGSRSDPASAHLIRMDRNLGSLLHDLSDRTTAVLHGVCLGSGIELPAFASRVIASPGTSIGLPELSFGLIPGAGGTVSLPRRIGRHRTAWLAWTGRRIGAETAGSWGLVDEVSNDPSGGQR